MGRADEIVIFGRSPFINRVDVANIINNHTTMAFNHFACLHPVDIVFYFDILLRPIDAAKTTVYVPSHFTKAPKAFKRYIFKEGNYPIKIPLFQKGIPVYARRYFTPSLGLNWSLLNGYTKAYLVGIDHIEDDRRFEHHDGEPCYSELTSASHKRFKNFVYECANEMDIYQCNPDVKDQWDLPYKDIKELYK